MRMKEKLDKKILYLETASNKTIIKLLSQSGIVISGFCEGSHNQSETLLWEIDRLLKKGKISKAAIRGVAVNIGQNSYTSARIIATTANFFAFSQNIPVFSISSGEHDVIFKSLSKKRIFQNHIIPVYENEPIITKNKSRL